MNHVRAYVPITIGLSLCSVLLCGCARQGEEKPKPTVTLENLQSAYAKELKFRHMYLQFATQAEKERLSGAARLYRALARSEALHAASHAGLLRSLGGSPVEPTMEPVVVGKTMQTLKMALSSEAIEAGHFYANLIKTAQAERVSEAVRQFTSVHDADAGHAELLSKAIRASGAVPAKSFSICPVCGYVMTPESVKDCAGCGVRKENFEVI